MRRRARDECDPAHHRIATRQNSGAPCCTTESPSADSAIGNRYSGYTSPRPSPPACRSGACHHRAWPAELTVQHTWRRDLFIRAGGIEALASEMAEDAAATKAIRKLGLRVRVVAY